MDYDKLMENVASQPLSKTLPIVLRLGIQLEEPALTKWVKLELNGYFNTNPELTDDVVVPEYRTVAGTHSDAFGRPLDIDNADLAFVNTTRLRFAVADLEKYANEYGQYSYRDPNMSELIRKFMNVDVTTYTFYTAQIAGVLSGIRTELIERLAALRQKIIIQNEKGVVLPSEDIVDLKPNFYGIGINLNALARKWREFTAKNK